MAAHGVARATLDTDLLVVDDGVLDRTLWSAAMPAEVSVELRVGGSDDPVARDLAHRRGIAAQLRGAATIEGSLAAADVTGGTAPARVAAALALARERLGA